MKVFLDTSIVNDLMDLYPFPRRERVAAENLRYLKLIVDGPVASGAVTLYVNPTVKQQIDATKDERRRTELSAKFKEFYFTEFNLTIFPFRFPAQFLTKEQEEVLSAICQSHPALSKDRKIIADSAFNNQMDGLLTTDEKLARQVPQVGNVRVFLPKTLWEHLNSPT